MLTTLLSILTNRILWSFLGVTALAAVIWMIGPLLSIVDTRPLESEQNRIISIAVVYLLWAQGHILPRLYNAWLNRKLMDKLNENTTSPEAADPQKRLNSEEQILASRFDEAAQMLKKAHFSKAGQGAQWTQRFSTQYLYQLPWYVIIGAPGSGKTTALVNSGLQFPLADRFGKTALRALAARVTATGGLPTRRCCWTRRAAIPPRRASRCRTPANGCSSWGYCASIAAASRSTASSSPSAFLTCSPSPPRRPASRR
jgi:type VI protein secretion system component VasK